MSTLSGYYSGDVRAARAAYRAHVARADVRSAVAARPRHREPAGTEEYEDYDGDLAALLATFRGGPSPARGSR